MRVLLISGLLLLFTEDCFLILDTAANNVPFHVNTNLSRLPQFYLRAPKFDDKCCFFFYVPLCSVSSVLSQVKCGTLGRNLNTVGSYICRSVHLAVG